MDLKKAFEKVKVPVFIPDNIEIKSVTPSAFSVDRAVLMSSYSEVLKGGVFEPPEASGVVAGGVLTLTLPDIPRIEPIGGYYEIKAMGLDVTFGGGDAVTESGALCTFVVEFKVNGRLITERCQARTSSRKGHVIVLFADFISECVLPVIYEHSKQVPYPTPPTGHEKESCQLKVLAGPNGMDVGISLLTNKHEDVMSLFKGSSIAKALAYESR